MRVLTKAEAEAIMGQADLRGNNSVDCWYVEAGWTNKPPKNKQVRLGIHTKRTCRVVKMTTTTPLTETTPSVFA
ncbi:hypothetical protein [Nitrospira sp. Nam74]